MRRRFKLPRLVWIRKPATKVKPDNKKEAARRMCRAKGGWG